MWITSFWPGDNFEYLADELRAIGIDAAYEQIPMTSELWLERIRDGITRHAFDGWALVLTDRVTGRGGRARLVEAIAHVGTLKGAEFPLVALLACRTDRVPDVVRSRFCVELADENWRKYVLSCFVKADGEE